MDPETGAELASSLAQTLGRVAANSAGRAMIDRTLAAVYRNPHPRYRDLALREVGTAVVRTTDRFCVRAQLQSIVRAGLHDEGITFTFDLPALLVAEGDRRGGGRRTPPVMAQRFALGVYDPGFRRERMALAADFDRWCAEPAPGLPSALAEHRRLVALDPHPNPGKAAEGRRPHRLEPDPVTAPVVQRIFTEYVAGRGMTSIARGLTQDGMACLSTYDRARNPQRHTQVWETTAVRAILLNPRYTGKAPRHTGKPYLFRA